MPLQKKRTRRKEMNLRDIMTNQIEMLPPDASILDAAQLMDSNDIGSVPVVDDGEILGLVTDRDITVKVIAKGLDPNQVQLRDIMTSPIITAYEDQSIDEAGELMEAHQIRRLVVLDRAKKLVGIVALGDLATRSDALIAAEVLEEVSEQDRGVA
ncbi:MAG: CBS domain-containing protein [Proteobacteria bacterium]|nr:MAG: CBS domain-containing protein [Pseudomonadota bacterium]